MSLTTQVTDRISGQLLIELTNHGSTTASSVNSTRLAAAVADAEGQFLVEVGVAYDDSDAAHVAVAVDGVLWYLHIRTGQTGRNVDAIQSRWNAGLIRLAATRGSERRLLPTSSSPLEASTETTGRRPDSDRDRWSDYVPAAPGGDDDED